MNRFEGRGPTRFGYSNDSDDRMGGLPGTRRERSPGFGRDREGGDTRASGWDAPTQGDYRGGYPSNGSGWRVEDHYRDREGRFGTTYGMAGGQESRSFPRDNEGYADFRDSRDDLADRSGYQDNEGWGGQGLEEVRGASGHQPYDPRYSRQDARQFGGHPRFGQGWEGDRFASRERAGLQGGYDRDGAFGARVDNRFEGRFPMGVGSFEAGGGDVRSREGDRRFGGMDRSRGMGGTSRSGMGMTGRGPKGYVRSDERIREDICELLSRQGRIDASEVDVKVAGGEVTLTGTVMQRGDKLEIEHIVEHVSGVKDVHNQIRRAPLTSGQSTHTGNLTGATQRGGSGAPDKDRENGTKSPNPRHSS